MARGKTVTLQLDKIERRAFEIAVWRGLAALEHSLRLDGFDEPNMLVLAAARRAVESAPAGDVEVSLSLAEAVQLEVAVEVGLALVRSQQLVQNVGPMERARDKLKAAIR